MPDQILSTDCFFLPWNNNDSGGTLCRLIVFLLSVISIGNRILFFKVCATAKPSWSNQKYLDRYFPIPKNLQNTMDTICFYFFLLKAKKCDKARRTADMCRFQSFLQCDIDKSIWIGRLSFRKVFQEWNDLLLKQPFSTKSLNACKNSSIGS